MKLSRRNFFKTSLLSLGTAAFFGNVDKVQAITNWADSEFLGRNCMGGVINVRSRPSANSPIVSTLYEDAVFPWLREVVGEAPYGLINRRWVETPDGYVYAASVQPVRYKPNEPLAVLPQYGEAPGMWAEVTVPYVDIIMANPPARSPWLRELDTLGMTPRLYYSQVMWVDGIQTDSNGQVFYRVNERYGSYGDIFWADATAFRPMTQEELSPISPNAEEKKVVVDLSHQSMSCYEGSREVYYCKVSTGARFDAYGNPVEEWSTPIGPHPIWRKLISIHMSGGGTGAGWDTPGVAWTSLFAGTGVAIHSTFWHNDYGTPRSHGCVNAAPEDAKWVFRWTLPYIDYEPGDLTIQGLGSTQVEVLEYRY
jgi:lipoprotein-anchoring transpeptidase ErfK/SrfK